MIKRLTEYELTLLLFCRDNTPKLAQLSATRTRAHWLLKEYGLHSEDDDGFISNTELGDKILDKTIFNFAELALRCKP